MNQHQQPRVFDVSHKRRKLSMPPKQKRWSHQDQLSALVGKNVTISLLDVGDLTGKLLNADQFTIQLELKNARDNSLFARTFFKSALTYFNEA